MLEIARSYIGYKESPRGHLDLQRMSVLYALVCILVVLVILRLLGVI